MSETCQRCRFFVADPQFTSEQKFDVDDTGELRYTFEPVKLGDGRCHRYPQIVIKDKAHWCGEFENGHQWADSINHYTPAKPAAPVDEPAS